jgi:hypothetical protein
VSPPEKEAAVPDSLPETPGPDTVLIHLEGVPNKSVVKVDGVVSTLPLRLPRSSEILTVTVATKKKHWRHRIVPDRDRHLPVRMKLKKNAIQ